eukprot:TRINITY_DN8035_c0_g1_i1.p1 TRINITY_DN8035_c0_g1~~TRINITY_DN8035_c0_g1_i1.p1  ORF type:complete len:232 (+),score=-3.72 TRINITY_DN8035_c0_g1_i1:84-779(+)
MAPEFPLTMVFFLLFLSVPTLSANGASVSSIVTNGLFNQIVSPTAKCAGKGVYTYSGFINAANTFPKFGTSSSDEVNKREIAAFFGNAAHETGGFCQVAEDDQTSSYCNSSYTQYPCAAGKKYFGRGPLQLSWNYNYGLAGRDLSFDGLKNPELVASNPAISWKTAVWFWMKNSMCHSAFISGGGFGATIKAINSMECGDPKSADKVNNRINNYKKFCKVLGVDPGPNLSC